MRLGARAVSVRRNLCASGAAMWHRTTRFGAPSSPAASGRVVARATNVTQNMPDQNFNEHLCSNDYVIGRGGGGSPNPLETKAHRQTAASMESTIWSQRSARAGSNRHGSIRCILGACPEWGFRGNPNPELRFLISFPPVSSLRRTPWGLWGCTARTPGRRPNHEAQGGAVLRVALRRKPRPNPPTCEDVYLGNRLT